MRHLEREGKSPATIIPTPCALNAWERSIVARGRSLDPYDLEREDAEAFLDALPGTNRVPSTHRQRASIARLWCDWLIDQGVREEPNPWTKVAKPKAGPPPAHRVGGRLGHRGPPRGHQGAGLSRGPGPGHCPLAP